jgi:hypothetical protein
MEMNMLEAWPAIVFGWPAILASIALSIMGIVRRRPKWLVVAAIVALPFSLYLAGSPAFGWLGLSIPLLLAGASVASRYDQPIVAWSLLAPFVGVSGWLAIVVMTE